MTVGTQPGPLCSASEVRPSADLRSNASLLGSQAYGEWELP